MTDLLAASLAFVIAAGITGLELITSKYPRTFFLLFRCVPIYGYIRIYGLIGFGATLLLPYLPVKIEGLDGSSTWIRAIVVGISIKAILHIRLFNVTTGAGNDFPVGLETFLQLFEPWLLRTIDLEHFMRLRRYIGAKIPCYPDIAAVKPLILANIPSTFTSGERAALTADVATLNTVGELMELYLTYVGRGAFEQVFP